MSERVSRETRNKRKIITEPRARLGWGLPFGHFHRRKKARKEDAPYPCVLVPLIFGTINCPRYRRHRSKEPPSVKVSQPGVVGSKKKIEIVDASQQKYGEFCCSKGNANEYALAKSETRETKGFRATSHVFSR